MRVVEVRVLSWAPNKKASKFNDLLAFSFLDMETSYRQRISATGLFFLNLNTLVAQPGATQ